MPRAWWPRWRRRTSSAPWRGALQARARGVHSVLCAHAARACRTRRASQAPQVAATLASLCAPALPKALACPNAVHAGLAAQGAGPAAAYGAHVSAAEVSPQQLKVSSGCGHRCAVRGHVGSILHPLHTHSLAQPWLRYSCWRGMRTCRHNGRCAHGRAAAVPPQAWLTYPPEWGPSEWGPIPFLPDNDVLVRGLLAARLERSTAPGAASKQRTCSSDAVLLVLGPSVSGSGGGCGAARP